MHTQTGQIVVGYDGSEPADAAVDWAAAQAQHRGLPLLVVSVIDSAGEPQEEATRLAAQGAQRAEKSAESIEITAVGRVGQVPATLIESAQDADLLVLGTRGRSELAGAIVGSVTFSVSAHAACPVVVVRGQTASPGPDRPVIVGVDGSLCARIALRCAADVASRTGATLRVVNVYSSDRRPAQKTSAEQLAHAAAYAAAQVHSDLELQELTAAGSAAEQLVRLAEGCGLLVVGTRGFGGFAGLLLGSVGHGVLHSAPCPVMIVPVVVS
jgi:nucleotide-binding universal stress UspA family protein